MSWRRWLVLYALSAGPAAAAAGVLRAVRFGTAMALAPQISAPAPYGSFHDVRWILVYHRSWPQLAAEVAAAVALRSALSAGIVVAVRPELGRRPHLPRLLLRTLSYHAAILAVLAPWAAVAVALGATALSWFVFGELAPVLLLSWVLQRGGTGVDWWSGVPGLLLVGLATATFAAICLAALALAYTPGWWAVPVAGVAGAGNGWLWYRMVTAAARTPPRLRRLPVAALAVVAMLVGLSTTGRIAAAAVYGVRLPAPPITHATSAGVRQFVIFVPGYDSVFDGTGPPPGRLPFELFSYRGLGPDGRPLPYRADDTHESLATSARLLRQQVAAGHRRSGRPVALLAQSEGTLVVRRYLEAEPHAAVDAVVLLSPLVHPAWTYYPPPGAHDGWGIAGGWLLRGLLAVVQATGGPGISPDEPFVRSVLDDAPRYRNRMLCPVPGVRIAAFRPLADVATDPPGRSGPVAVVGAPGWHAALLDRADVQRDLVAFLNGWTPRGGLSGIDRVSQGLAAGWQAPALALRVNPVWAADRPDAAFGQDGCAGPGR